MLTVEYAVPGSSLYTGTSASNVDYSSSTGYGSTTQITHAFSNDLSVSLKVGEGSGAGWKTSNATSSTVTISAIQGTSNAYYNPTDGINHDLDKIFVWTNPGINLVLTSPISCNGQICLNPLDPNSSDPTIGIDCVSVQVGMLRGTITMDYNTSVALSRQWDTTNKSQQSLGAITTAEYQDILARDPYSSLGNSTAVFIPPTNRFLPARVYNNSNNPTQFISGGPVEYRPNYFTQTKGTFSSTQTNQSQQTYSEEYSVSVGFDFSFFGLFGGSLKDTMSWADTYMQTNSNTQTQTAAYNIWTPSSKFVGPGWISVYTDNLYGTFLFTYVEM